ncbi:MAG: methyltransferase domain-containing protein [Akkermansiaceae bacterium]|nr:methyltransferase domain-containing protein [Akkermansiaceae bacterium]
MNDGVRQLYETRTYPPMSHPLADPAVSTVAAWIGGLDAKPPGHTRVLEIGCSSGLNLIPLAMRWPDSRFTGIDLAQPAIDTARELVGIAGLRNIEFLRQDLREFDAPPESFDIIIAHGFFSWVPDEVKSALFAFCRKHLAPSGFATISFNLSCGWSHRFPVIEKVRAIQQAGDADVIEALHVLREVIPDESEEIAIIDDMLAKGPDILAFDDFGPVNDPWPLDRFIAAAEEAGLSWVGESDPGHNFPRGLDAETVAKLRAEHPDPLALQCAADEAARRTFRSGVLCLNDAPRMPGIHPKRLLELPVRIRNQSAPDTIQQAIEKVDPNLLSCFSISELRNFSPILDERIWMQDLWRGLLNGGLELRTDGLRLDAEAPEHPRLNAFRLACVRRGMPVVDAWHRPCRFPTMHEKIVSAMDGTNDLDTLRAMARADAPDLAFDPWIRHLAGRGFFL